MTDAVIRDVIVVPMGAEQISFDLLHEEYDFYSHRWLNVTDDGTSRELFVEIDVEAMWRELL